MPQQISYIAIILIIVWAIYRRVRRHIGWQHYKVRALVIRTAIFIVIGILLLAGGLANPWVFVSDAVGILLGCVFVYFGLATTEFREENGKWFYRSNPWLGFILIAIVLGRIVYRFVVVYQTYKTMASNGGTPNQYNFNTYISHPYTAGIIFILVAYYAGYYFLLIRKKNAHADAN